MISRSSELSEMLSISLNSEESKMRVRANYKHSTATRLAPDRLLHGLHFERVLIR